MIVSKIVRPVVVRSILIFYLLSLYPVYALARQQKRPLSKKLNVAVLDFAARTGLTDNEAASLSDVFQAKLVQSGDFVVVDRARIKQILTEQGFQQSESCSQVECIVEAGKILKVEKMFAGAISKIGKTFSVNIQLINISTAEIQLNKARSYQGDIDDLVTEIIPDMADELMAELTGREYTAKSGSTWLYYIGGAVLVGGGAAAYILLNKETTPPTPQPTPLPDPSSFPQ
jgi:TolB-like protein